MSPASDLGSTRAQSSPSSVSWIGRVVLFPTLTASVPRFVSLNQSRSSLARARRPFAARALTETEGFTGDDYETDLARLRATLQASGLQVPTLFKQYTEAVLPGGAAFLDFGVDPDFGHCVDGLILIDLQQLRDSHRRRYLAERLPA